MKTDKDFKTFKEWQKEDENANLIPVHINKARSENFFWNWDSDLKDWIRGEELTEKYKRMHKKPLAYSNYSKYKF